MTGHDVQAKAVFSALEGDALSFVQVREFGVDPAVASRLLKLGVHEWELAELGIETAPAGLRDARAIVRAAATWAVAHNRSDRAAVRAMVRIVADRGFELSQVQALEIVRALRRRPA